MAKRILAALAAMLLLCAGSASAQHRDNGGPIAEHTFFSYDPTHRMQIEYLDGAGNAYLWYPHEARALAGVWRTEDDQICFSYPDYVFDLTPSMEPGAWICMTLAAFYQTTLSKVENDPFELRSGKVPFTLERSDYFDGFTAVVRAIEGGRD